MCILLSVLVSSGSMSNTHKPKIMNIFLSGGGKANGKLPLDTRFSEAVGNNEYPRSGALPSVATLHNALIGGVSIGLLRRQDALEKPKASPDFFLIGDPRARISRYVLA